VITIGAKVPNSGPFAHEPGIVAAAGELEAAGFESLWVSDHIVMPKDIHSRYPFAADGRATWSTATPWFDAIVALAVVGAVTTRATIGTAVLVLPLRQPVILAKQLASIDALTGGRVTLGVGAGWLREEFEALEVPFESRGARLEEWIQILRDCWTGAPAAHSGAQYELPGGLVSLPTPAHELPILIGGHSRPALRRAATLADGWLGQQSLDQIETAEIESVRQALSAETREGATHRIVLRIVDSAGRAGDVATHLPALAKAGVDEIIVDVDWADGDARADYERLASGR
jgi:probable F420-dependent oxidoreductase